MTAAPDTRPSGEARRHSGEAGGDAPQPRPISAPMPRANWRSAGAPVVLAGPNGAGKTNILDAISLLSPGRGLRGAKLAEHVRKGPVAPSATRCGRWRRR